MFTRFSPTKRPGTQIGRKAFVDVIAITPQNDTRAITARKGKGTPPAWVLGPSACARSACCSFDAAAVLLLGSAARRTAGARPSPARPLCNRTRGPARARRVADRPRFARRNVIGRVGEDDADRSAARSDRG